MSSYNQNNPQSELPQIPWYKVTGVLSRAGGMSGGVYRAIDLRHPAKREVAIKELKMKTDHYVDLFRREANNYLYLSHPRLMKLRNYAEHNGNHYLIMELVQGNSLRDHLYTQTGPIVTERAVPMFLKILDAIGYLHSKDFMHLDIKPDNIMVQSNDEIKIIDMGISTERNNINDFIIRAGTPLYRAPEQLDNKRPDFFTDIWMLGVTLFEMLTATRPFYSVARSKDEFEQELHYQIRHAPVPRVTESYPWINSDIQRILEKALAKNPNNRYHCCAEFAEDLRDKFILYL